MQTAFHFLNNKQILIIFNSYCAIWISNSWRYFYETYQITSDFIYLYFYFNSLPASGVGNRQFVNSGYGFFWITLCGERAVTDSTTLFFSAGISTTSIIFDDCEDCHNYNIGFKKYFKDHAFDGGYVGLQASRITFHGKLFGIAAADGDTINYYSLLLGYKKTRSSGFTYESLIYTGYCPESEDTDPFIACRFGIGYSW